VRLSVLLAGVACAHGSQPNLMRIPLNKVDMTFEVAREMTHLSTVMRTLSSI
jgi:hypothetical protein